MYVGSERRGSDHYSSSRGVTGVAQQVGAGFSERVPRRVPRALLAFAITASLLLSPIPSGAGTTTGVGMGTAGAYSALAYSTITNTGASTLHGSLGLHPESDVTGFTFSTSPGLGQVLGAVNIANAAALQAKNDLTAAYGDAASRTFTSAPVAELAGATLLPGVHGSDSALLLSVGGTLILDAQGDPTAVFIIKAASELTIGSGSSVVLAGNAQACNVFWQVGSSATVGTGASFVGTIMAQASISVATSATIQGRALALTGAVTLDTNTIFQPGCNLTAGEGAGGETDGDDELSDTGAGMVLLVLIGGLALLIVGGRVMAFANRKQAGLR